MAACDAVCDATAAGYLGDVGGYGRVLAQLALRSAGASCAPALQMARPSSVRLRIEALHRRLYAARLARAAVLAFVVTGVLVAGICGALSVARATLEPADEGHAVIGRVVDEQGLPIAGATVYVHSLHRPGLQTPQNQVIHPDQGLQVITNANGRFRLPKLTSGFLFRLLIVADGHRPQMLGSVDPRDDKRLDVRLASRPIPKDPRCVVRGQVIEPSGKPAGGVLVEPYGIWTEALPIAAPLKVGQVGGRLDSVDEMAVTNERGEFVLVCDKPVASLDVKVASRGGPRAKIQNVKSGDEKNRLQLKPGVTVTGRILDHGKPAPGMKVGACQSERGPNTFLGPYQTETDVNGRFTMANLPTQEDLYVYMPMDSMRDGFALPVKRFQPTSEKPFDLGELSIQPALSVRGRIALSDGKPIPPDTRVYLNREDAWDSTSVAAAADGAFSFPGLSPGVISLRASLRGYRLSPKNKSFESLILRLKGKVSENIEDLVVLYESGQPVRSGRGRDQGDVYEAYQRLATQRLAGVTAALTEFPPERTLLPKIELPAREALPDPGKTSGPAKSVTGVVLDANKQPIREGRVWLPLQWLNPLETLTASAGFEKANPFVLTFPQAWLQSNNVRRNHTVWAYAPGHAIGTVSVNPRLIGVGPAKPLQIELPSAGNLTFVVLLPDGKPAVGARVQPWHFQTGRISDLVPSELADLAAGTTDTAGRAALPALTRDSVATIYVKLAGFGTQQFRCELRSTDPPEQTLRLRKTGRIEGQIATNQLELTRDMFMLNA